MTTLPTDKVIRMFNPHQHLTQAFNLTGYCGQYTSQEFFETLTDTQRADLLHGGYVVLGAARAWLVNK